MSITMNLQATALIPNECAHAQADQFQTASAIANRQPFADDDARPRAGARTILSGQPSAPPNGDHGDVREPPGFMSGSRRKLRGEADGSVKLTRPMRVQLLGQRDRRRAHSLRRLRGTNPETTGKSLRVPKGRLAKPSSALGLRLIDYGSRCGWLRLLVRIRFPKPFIQRASFCSGVWR